MKGKYLRKVLIGVVAAVTAFISYSDGRVNAEEVYGDAASAEIVDVSEYPVDMISDVYPLFEKIERKTYDADGNCILTEKHRLDANTGNVVRLEYRYPDNYGSIYEFSYNDDGTLAHLNEYLIDGTQIGYREYSYSVDGYNKVLTINSYNMQGTLQQYWIDTTFYNSKGELQYELENSYLADGTYQGGEKVTYFRGTSVIQSIYRYASNTSVIYKQEYIYDGSVLKEQKLYMRSGLSVTNQIWKFEYDSNGFVKCVKIYSNTGVYQGRIDVVCDNEGNSIKETTYDENGVMVEWEERKLENKIVLRNDDNDNNTDDNNNNSDDDNNSTNNNNSEDNNNNNNNSNDNNQNNNEKNNQDNNENNNNNTKPGFEIFNVADGCAMQARMYNPNSGEHFYTGSQEEVQILIDAGWNFEGPGFITPTTGTPIYRLYSEKYGDHFYTTSETERDSLVAEGWKLEGSNNGIAFPSATSGTPMYRLHNPNAYNNNESGAHHFTTSMQEVHILEAAGWEFEGVAWYSL